MEKQIGWFHLKEDKVFTNTYETAAWYENVLVPKGDYPLMVYDYCTTKTDHGTELGHHCYYHVPMDGTITSDYFGTLFFGVPVGTYDGEKNKGKKSSHSMFCRDYIIAEEILDGSEEWELFPEYEAREIRFISSFDNRECVTHGIFLKEEN